MLNRVCSSVALIAMLSAPAFAQFELGSASGTVRDQSELPMANATVEVRSLSTNAVRQTVTSEVGEFVFLALPPGQYTLTAKQQGFKERTENFQLAVGQRLSLNISMEVGTSTQNVTVSAEAVALETASSDVNNVRTNQQAELHAIGSTGARCQQSRQFHKFE
jgi:hypothetical protein